ncbi:MAG: Gldg family protein, partial [Stellaceae bacterium]
MLPRSFRLLLEAALFLLAVGLGMAALTPVDETAADVLYFGAWCAAMLLIFSLGLRLPIYLRGRLRRIASPVLVGVALGLALLATIALYRHDAHFDATVSGRFTPPPELETVARSLQHDVVLTYFYNRRDDYADAAKQVLAMVARRHPHLRVRVLDLDTELVAARDYGVKLYNTAVVEAEGRRTQVENTVDLRQMAYAIERVLQRRVQTVCFVTGHGEHYAPGHVHYGHVETLGGDQPGRSDILEAPPDGLDRLKLAIETIGYRDRAVAPATLPAIPEDCAVVADFGATSAYAPAEVQVLRDYLLRGGHALLAYDPRFRVALELASLLDEVGFAIGDGVVVDPLNHYGTDQEQAAVPYYPPHPITQQIALTVFAGARPIRLRGPVAGLTAAELVATSKDSHVRPLDPTARPADAAATAPGPRLLAAAAQGTWPGGGGTPFRL